ncbi:MAG: hypothetical protein GWM87_14145 [Xanthomonadales bacterium]|nr:hypothetical protein [Xanthomonadales bacterium]NIX13954.1 hypothetical protein [Xanthomonadales bacterium]
MYRNAPFWFAGLLVLQVLGFWPSYFSPSAPDATFGQHFHSVTMLGWMLMLIAQSWLIRARKRDIHRVIGRFSMVWAPLIVFSALYVVVDHLVKFPQPTPPIGIGFFWLGLASATYYAIFYVLAIKNRREMQLHARYMAATVLAFVVPALGRLSDMLGEMTGLTFLNFFNALWAPVIIGLVMMWRESRKGGVRLPWALASGLQFVIVIGFHNMYKVGWFVALSDWYRGFA